jgi:hypothetical protein
VSTTDGLKGFDVSLAYRRIGALGVSSRMKDSIKMLAKEPFPLVTSVEIEKP